MKRMSILSGILVMAALTACGTANPTQDSSPPEQTPVMFPATEILPASSPTPAIQPPTPTATEAPANLQADNFSEFAQVRSFFQEIEAAVGGDLFNMRLDAAALSPDGRYAAIGGCTTNWDGHCQSRYHEGDSFLFILDTLTGDLVASIPEKDTDITSLAFTPDSEKLIYATYPIRIVVWDIPSGQVERTILQDAGTYSDPTLSISPDGSQIAAAYLGSLSVWDAASGQEVTQQLGDVYGSALPQYSADGGRLAVFTRDDGSEIAVYDTASWERIALFQLPYQTGRVALSPDGTTLATIEDTLGADVLFWDVDTGAQAGSLGASFDYANFLTFSPDGQLLLVSSSPPEDDLYGGLTVWDVPTHQKLGTMPNLFPPRRILFSADATTLLMVDNTFPLVYRWTLPDEAVLTVRQAVLAFSAALKDGDYETAAGLYQPSEDDLAYFESLGLDTSSLPAMLETLCAQSSQPCAMTADEMLFEGQELDGSYSVMLSYTTPDGAQYFNETGDFGFWFYANLDDTGTASIITLPSFLYPQ